MSDSKSPKVAIVGAGLTGLLTAHGLRKAGFDVTLYDQEAGLDARPRDWPLLLHWALPTLMSLLSESTAANFPQAIVDSYLENPADAESMPIVNGKTGEILFRSSMPGVRRVRRQLLRRLLAAEFDNGTIEWGKDLEKLKADGDGPVQLSFTDGTTAEADYVLGADGAGSKVRELLFNGDEAARVRPSGLMAATGVVKHGDPAKVQPVLDLHPVAAVTMGTEFTGGVSVFSAEDPKDLSTWTMTWIMIWRRGTIPDPPAKKGPEALAFIKEKTKNLPEPFKSQVSWTPDDESRASCYIDEMRTWVPVPWETYDKVSLAGDAAHPMLVYRGQGFQHAIVDAERYIEALVSVRDKGVKSAEAIKTYTDDVVERGAKAVTQSLREAELSMDLESVGKMMMAKQGHSKAA